MKRRKLMPPMWLPDFVLEWFRPLPWRTRLRHSLSHLREAKQ